MNGKLSYRFGDFQLELDLTDELREVADDPEIDHKQALSAIQEMYAEHMFVLFRATQTAARWIKADSAQQGVQRLPGQAADTANGKVSIETIQVEKITHTFDKNTHYFKVWGGKYQKYGVAMWSDSCKGGEWAFQLPMGEHNNIGTVTAAVEVKDGKPTRVLELIRTSDPQMDIPF